VPTSCRRASTAAGNGPHRKGWLPSLAALGILGVLVWRLGTGPFIAGLARVDAGSLAAASGVAVVTTLSCAWRWTLVARSLGVALPLPTAVAAYYRSQFLNAATPGGHWWPSCAGGRSRCRGAAAHRHGRNRYGVQGPTSGRWRSPGIRGQQSSSPRSWPCQATS
jgi:hypothetical protein